MRPAAADFGFWKQHLDSLGRGGKEKAKQAEANFARASAQSVRDYAKLEELAAD